MTSASTDYPYGNMQAGRQFLDQMPINPVDKEKIAHLNAELARAARGALRDGRGPGGYSAAQLAELLGIDAGLPADS